MGFFFISLLFYTSSFAPAISNSKNEKETYKKVVIWGMTANSDQLIKFLTGAGSEVIGIIDPTPEHSSIYDHLISGIQKIKARQIPPNIPVVTGSLSNAGEKEKKLFEECLTYCTKNNIRVLHPAAFLPRSPLKYKNKVKVYGFPGAGNVLFQNFLITFLPKNNPPLRSSEEIFSSMIALDYKDLILNYLVNCFKEKVPLDSGGSVDNGYYGSLRVAGEKNRSIIVHNVPVYSFTWDVFVGGHGFLKASDIRFFSEKGLKNIQVLRNPLDSFLSLMRKSNVFLPGHNYNRLDPTILENTFTNYYFKEMVTYYSHVVKNKKNVFLVKYEDLTTHPIPTLLKVCEFLNISVTPKEIQDWWNKTGFKVINPNSTWSKTHFKGGKSKWKEYFTTAWLPYFQKNNLINISHELGYSLEKEEFKFSSSNIEGREASLKVRGNIIEKKRMPLSWLWYPLLPPRQQLITPSGHLVGLFDPEKILSQAQRKDLLFLIDMGVLNY